MLTPQCRWFGYGGARVRCNYTDRMKCLMQLAAPIASKVAAYACSPLITCPSGNWQCSTLLSHSDDCALPC